MQTKLNWMQKIGLEPVVSLQEKGHNMTEEQGIFASEGAAREFTLVPESNHPARCYQVIDIGTHKTKFEKVQRKVRIFWEIPGETITIEGETKPLSISKEYTLSLGEKASLRIHLQAWRGKGFTPEELKKFNIVKLLGAPCLLSVVHKVRPDGNKYANIQGVSALPKGMVVPPAINEPRWYSVSQGKNQTFQELPEWIQKQCLECEEWTNPPDALAGTVEEEDQDSVPF